MSLINVNKCVKGTVSLLALGTVLSMIQEEKDNDINSENISTGLVLNVFDNYVTQNITDNKYIQYGVIFLTSGIASNFSEDLMFPKIFTASCLLKMITDDYNTHESSPLSEQTEELESQCSTEIEV